MADRQADTSGRPTRIPDFFIRSGADAVEDLLQCKECKRIFPTGEPGTAGTIIDCPGCNLPSRIPVQPGAEPPADRSQVEGT